LLTRQATSMPDPRPGSLGRVRARFRDWRRSRPFWGGLLTLLGGLEIVYLPLSPVSQLIAAGVVGAQSILVGFLIVVLGVFVWFSPANRTLAGVLTIIFSVSSLVLSNLGGLVVGMMAGIIGGALTVSWTDRPRRSRRGRPPASSPDPADHPADAGIAIITPAPPPASHRSDPGPEAATTGPGSEAVRARRPSPSPRTDPGVLRLGVRPARRRVVVVAVLAGLGLSWSVPATAMPSVEPAQPVEPSPECLAALADLPAGLLEHLLPGLRELVPGLAGLLPGLAPSRPTAARSGLLGLPVPVGTPQPVVSSPTVPLTMEELRRRQVLAGGTCRLPQLLPGDGTALLPGPALPPLPELPRVTVPDLRLPGLPGLPPVPRLPGLPSPGPPLPHLPGLPLPQLPLPPLPELPLPELPRLPLPELPLPQLPELPFPELPGLPGLPGVDPPPDGADPPLPVQPDPDAGQRVFPAEDGDVAPTVTSDLTMGTLSVTSLVYQGIVELPTAAGGTVRALRFTIGTLDADALRIEVPTHTGRVVGLEHLVGNHVLGTGVVLDCTSLSLTAIGVLPLTFTLDAPPPPMLALPSLYSTDVEIDLVTLRLRTLSVPTADAGIGGPGTDRRDPASDGTPA
jgi:hypothetical protein